MKPIIDIAELQDQHLDAMLKLAFDHMDAKEIQQLVEEPDPELTPQEVEMADEIFLMALAKADKQVKTKKRQSRSSVMRRTLPRIIQVAAAIVLVFAIATPIAFATSAQFRSKVMQLLIEFDYEHGGVNYSFVENMEASFIVPAGWIGEYYPAYIPDGYSIWNMEEYVASVEYRSDGDEQIYFTELSDGATGYVGTDDTEISYVKIGNGPAQVIDGYTESFHVVTVTWSVEDRWFMLTTYNISTQETLQIASSVKKIVK